MQKQSSAKTDEFKNELIKLGMSDKSISDITFSYADHQFLVRLMTYRDETVKHELSKTVAEVLEPWYCKMEEIVIGQKNLRESINDLKEAYLTIHGRVNTLETSVGVHNTVLEGHNKLLRSVNRMKMNYTVLWITTGISVITMIALILHILLT